MKIFKDRQSAGKLLAKHLKQYRGQKNTIVLGIPRGGVVVAVQVAKSLKLPLDIMITRKIGAPSQPELALGAVDADGNVIWDEALIENLQFNENQIGCVKLKIQDEKEEIHRREKVYRQDKERLNVKGKTIILTDDGIATGSTTLAAINFLKKHQAKKITLAVPVASADSIEKITKELGRLGKVVVLEIPSLFQAVGQFYHQFEPVTDQEVVQLLSHG